MKHIMFLTIFCLAAVSLCCQAQTVSIDSLLKTYYKDNEPGAVILISRQGKTIFKKGYGLANLQAKVKISSSTNFNIGSLTKQFTAFSIVQLAAKNKLSLNDKLVKFFPDFNKQTGSRISIQQLLTHSSGIIDHYAFTDTNIVKHAVDKDVLNAVKNIDSTYFVPGTKYKYSNTAYCLLAMIIEKVSGIPFNEYIKQNIFTPQLMKHSVVLEIGKPIYHQALGYDFDSSKKTFRKLDAGEAIFFSTEGDGGIYTSADEYLQWFQSLQRPSAANKKVVEKCRAPQFIIAPSKNLSYGYGWFVREKGGTKAVYHSGSNGGFRAMVFSIPSQNYVLVIFSNRTGIDIENMILQINKIMGVTNNSFSKIEAFVAFTDSSLIFAPCKEII